MPIVAGLDGCRSGWVCLVKDTDAECVSAHILPSIDALLTLEPTPQLVAVDIPIGLPESGARDCDREARAHLKRPRASSVFPVPIRAVLSASSYAEACAIGQRIDGRKLSRQSWAIMPKIVEVDQFMRMDAAHPDWVLETHPEMCFWAWNGERPMAHGKKSPAGRIERERLIRSFYGSAPEHAKAQLPRGGYAPDDLLDAFAALWTAERAAAGKALQVPASPGPDAYGLRMAIVA